MEHSGQMKPGFQGRVRQERPLTSCSPESYQWLELAPSRSPCPPGGPPRDRAEARGAEGVPGDWLRWRTAGTSCPARTDL